MAKIELAGGYYEDSAIQFNAQRCTNMYPVRSEVDGGKSQDKLKYSMGHKLITAGLSTDDSLTIVATYVTSDGRYFQLQSLEFSGTFRLTVSERDSSGTQVAFASIITSNLFSRVKVIDNGLVMSIVTDTSEGFFYDLTADTLTLITDADWPAQVFDVTFKDTYFVWTDSATDRFYISSQNASDPTNCINALDFGTVESNPDSLQGIIGIGNEIAIFGTKTIEFFYNSGNVDFPFTRNSGATQEIGTISTYSISKLNNIVYFIGSNDAGYGIVYRMKGYHPERISTHAIERILKSQGDLTGVIAYTMQDEGHYFYTITLDDDQVFQFNETTGLWNELEYKPDTLDHKSFIPRHQSFAFNKNIVSATMLINDVSPKIVIAMVELSNSTFTYFGVKDFGAAFAESTYGPTRLRTLPHFTQENHNIQYHAIELDIQKGVGLASGDANDTNPVIILNISRDGGMTYGNDISLAMGPENVFRQRIRAQMLGIARDAVFKLTSTSAVQQEWFNIYVDFEVLSE